MNVKEVERIKELISKAEIESAKKEGLLQAIKQEWKKTYATDDIEVIRKQLEEFEAEEEKTNERLEVLYNKLLSCYDWGKLEEEIGF